MCAARAGVLRIVPCRFSLLLYSVDNMQDEIERGGYKERKGGGRELF